ncbi:MULTISPECIES: hypothetical protein [unclassified Paraburkholderia]|uniref:hypothetical protein n=1 Tax=unclassified Paraburkholderia TaxID=2615204 RepID=UPI0011C03222|nr:MULTISPECIES: hypothetical protein [unclassified Paraburkholderia]
MGRQTVDEYQVFLIASLSSMRAVAHFGCATAAIDRAAALSRGGFYASDAAAVFPAAATTLRSDSIGKAMFGKSGFARHQPTIAPSEPTFHARGG